MMQARVRERVRKNGMIGKRSRRALISISISISVSIAVTLAIGGCSSDSLPILPPLTESPTNRVAVGKWVWVDLVTQDLGRARKFYADLFGWTYDGDGRYIQILNEGKAIGGMITASDPERGSEWIGNLSVEDVDGSVALVKGLGGKLEAGPGDWPDRGRLAGVSDGEGAVLLLLRAEGGDPPDQEAAIGAWLWRELHTHDVKAAAEFYAQLAGYDFEKVDLDGRPYGLLSRDGAPRAGLVKAPDEVHPLWLPIVRVRNPEAVAERAEKLGGRIIMLHEEDAILIDPTGAPFGVRRWTRRDQAELESQR
jgi:predicted enzyme related to lactoylglutathione lyase